MLFVLLTVTLFYICSSVLIYAPNKEILAPPKGAKGVAPEVQLYALFTSRDGAASESFIKRIKNAVDVVILKVSLLTYGIGLYQDKPIYPLGYQMGLDQTFCFMHHVNMVGPLAATKPSDFLGKFHTSYLHDWPDGSLDALYRALAYPALAKQWKPMIVDGKVAVHRIVMLVVQSIPHLNGDARKAVLRNNALPHRAQLIVPRQPMFEKYPELLEQSPNAYCNTMDYPTLIQVQYMIRKLQVVPMIIVADHGPVCDMVGCLNPYQKRLCMARGERYQDPKTTTFVYYQDLVKAMEITAIVVNAGQYGANLREAIDNAWQDYYLMTQFVQDSNIWLPQIERLPTIIYQDPPVQPLESDNYDDAFDVGHYPDLDQICEQFYSTSNKNKPADAVKQNPDTSINIYLQLAETSTKT